MVEFKKKVVLLGDSAVGKTSMIRRFVEDKYDDNYISTVGAKVSKKTIYIVPEKETVVLTMMIWDVIGSQGYVSTQSVHIAGADCALLVHDLSRPETFESLLSYWIPLLHDVTAGVLPPIMIAGNKSDLVKSEDIPKQEDIFKEIFTSREAGPYIRAVYPLPMGWLPTSAKIGDNIEECFYMMGLMMYYPKTKYDMDLFDIYKGIGGIVVEDMVSEKHPETLIDLVDIIMAKTITLVGAEKAQSIIKGCFESVGLNKDKPSKPHLSRFIICIGNAMIKLGIDKTHVTSLREQWLEYLAKIKT